MKRSNKAFTFLLVLTFLLITYTFCQDTITSSQTIKDGETLVSSDESFELGFFTPSKNSKNRYLGIWYKKITDFTVVWVANRDNPIINTSGTILKLTENGSLALVNISNSIIWSSTTSRASKTAVVQLLDSGNLVIKEDENSDNYLWQSFDYPTDTILPGMKFGKNLVTGRENFISSWKSNEDPGTGDYTYHLDPTGYPQTILRKGANELYRTGPWNGVGYSGLPGLKKNSIYTFELVFDANEVYYHYELLNKSVVSRFVMNQSGAAERWTWLDRTKSWQLYLTLPIDNCDTYRQCGAFGSCNVGNSPICGCLSKFVPRFQEEWDAADWSNGCVRRTPLHCETDGFVRYSDIKLPDTKDSWFNSSMTLEECSLKCLRDCSCVAYTNSDVRNGGSGCLLWFGELLDIKVVYGAGQDIYIRMAASELNSRRKKTEEVIVALMSSLGVILCVSLVLYICKRRRIYLKLRKGGKENSVFLLCFGALFLCSVFVLCFCGVCVNVTNSLKVKTKDSFLFLWRDNLEAHVIGRHRERHNKDLELPLFDLTTISKATNSFSLSNKLGEGGFGPVYKGKLEDGREIAVKRLSKTSMQGLDEFKNEVIFIAKLQHRNLVKLIGCCIEEEENMLIYEYMHNRSLDLLLFDEEKSKLLDWPKRIQIISGIARGLMYLHQDSRLRIVHRDLKVSNILLDMDMNPKISDFGIARTFGGNDSLANTSRVVGTYGYMSPEYAIDGFFSVKSDVFSFGVIVLEVVSGKRNRGFSHNDHHHNLLGHAWMLYKEVRSLELVDHEDETDSCYLSEVLRLIHVGLLCVQKYPEDRPSMSLVVFMLENEEVVLPEAKQPGFFTERNAFLSDKSTSTKASSTNDLTITMPEAR